jgi:hypothetical protein
METPSLPEFDLRWLVLSRGRHPRQDVGLCVLEAIAAYKGLPHSDFPEVLPVGICHIVQVMNDCAGSDETLTRLWKDSVVVLAEFDYHFDEIVVYAALEKTIASIVHWGLEPLNLDEAAVDSPDLDTFPAGTMDSALRGKAIAGWIERSCKEPSCGRDVYMACYECIQTCLGAEV